MTGAAAAALAGLVGGALAGAADMAATLPRLHSVLSVGRVLSLVALGTGLGALAGAVLALLVVGLARALAPVARSRAAAVAAGLAAAPLLGYDAFAMFQGARAARIPGHHALSVALALAGTGAVALAAAGFAAWARRPSRVRTALLVALAAAVYAANRVVLPRLYPWFHVTLAFAYLALGVLVARSSRAPREGDGTRAAVAAAVAALLAASAWPALARSQAVRFLAYERAQLASVLVRALPVRRAPDARPALAGTEDGPDADPLPEGPHRPDADVVLITIDALRADHLGAYGYPRPITPNIDALARRAVRFERAYAQVPHTSFSVACMLTGKYYPAVTRLGPADPHDAVPAILRRYGWKTAGFYPPSVFTIEGDKLKAYEEDRFDFEYVKYEYMDDGFDRVAQIQEFFRLDRPRKAFLWVHMTEPHEPYQARDGFAYGNKDLDRYDSEIAHADAAVGKLLAFLAETRPGAIVIVAADHGEEFDEHKGRYHGTTLFEEQVRVPLIVAVPGVRAHVVAGPVELVDLAPTILGLLDVQIPLRVLGHDLGPWLRDPPAPEERLPPAFAEIKDKRMVVFGREKLICDVGGGYCEYYDLATDPHEQRNLADERADRAALLRGKLDRWLDQHGRYEPARAPGEPVPRAVERGRLGDQSVADELAALLTSTEPLPIRREAARLLATSMRPRPQALPAVVRALASEDAELRDWAAVAAVRLGDASARERVKEILQRPAPPPVRPADLRAQAALALAQLHDPAGVTVLADALDACVEDTLLCQSIITTLGELRDPRAVPALLRHLPAWQNRRETVMALGQIADPQVVGALVERLKSDDYVPVRAEAARALGHLGGVQAQTALEWALGHEAETLVLAAVREALNRSASPPPATRDRGRSPRPRKPR